MAQYKSRGDGPFYRDKFGSCSVIRHISSSPQLCPIRRKVRPQTAQEPTARGPGVSFRLPIIRTPPHLFTLFSCRSLSIGPQAHDHPIGFNFQVDVEQSSITNPNEAFIDFRMKIELARAMRADQSMPTVKFVHG